MSWQVLIILSILFSSISTLLQKVLMKDEDSDPIAAAIFFQILMTILVGIIGVFAGQTDFTGMVHIIPNLVIMTVLIGLFYIFIFKALKLIDASEFIVILSTRPLFTIIASTLLLNEGLSIRQLLGVMLILLGVAVVTINKFNIKFRRGEILALLAAVALGLANTNDRIALNSVQLVPYIFLSAILPGVFISIFNIGSLSKMRVLLNKKQFSRMFLMSILQTGAIFTLLGALKFASNSSQVISLNEISVILTVILGIIFLKERNNLARKLTGAGFSLVGLMLVV